MKTLMLLILMALTPITQHETYPRTMFVTDINEGTDVVTLTDSVGYQWEFYGVEDWMVGDICSCIMDNNGTENIEDDVIISTRYNGYIGRN